MNLLYRLLSEFEKEYDLELCVIINHKILYGIIDNKTVEINFINHDMLSKLYFNKAVDDLSIKYLISVINNIYEVKDESLLLDNLFSGKLNEQDNVELNNFLNDKTWCLVKMYFNSNVKLENVVNNIFDCKYIFVYRDKGAYLLIEKDKSKDRLLLELKDTIESEMYTEIRMLYIDSLNNRESILEAYNKLNVLGDIFINHSSYKIASDKDFKLESLIDKVDDNTLIDVLNNITKANFNELDAELLNTINIFLDNNLSISNTAKELYIHRNTLIYRLDKIKQITGLDIRIFKDAFWMVIAKTIYTKLK